MVASGGHLSGVNISLQNQSRSPWIQTGSLIFFFSIKTIFIFLGPQELSSQSRLNQSVLFLASSRQLEETLLKRKILLKFLYIPLIY